MCMKQKMGNRQTFSMKYVEKLKRVKFETRLLKKKTLLKLLFNTGQIIIQSDNYKCHED